LIEQHLKTDKRTWLFLVTASQSSTSFTFKISGTLSLISGFLLPSSYNQDRQQYEPLQQAKKWVNESNETTHTYLFPSSFRTSATFFPATCSSPCRASIFMRSTGLMF
jgi:hypothetical protein